MCSTPKMPVMVTKPAEVIKAATQADASVQKANIANRTNVKGLVSENIRTSNNGIEDDIQSSKKRLLGE